MKRCAFIFLIVVFDLSLHAQERGTKDIISISGRFGLPLVTFGDDRTANNVTFNDGMIFTLKLIFNMKVPE